MSGSGYGVLSPRSWRVNALIEAVALVGVFLCLEWLSFLHEQDGLPVTPWNPGLGVMFAALIMRGASHGVVFFIAVLLSEVLILNKELSFRVILASSAIVSISYSIVALAVRRYLEPIESLLRTRDIIALALAGLTGAVICGLLLFPLLISVKHFDLADMARMTAPLVVGDLIGIVVVAPLCLRAAQFRMRPENFSLSVTAEFAGYAALTFAILVVTMLPGHQQQNLFYLLFLPTVVAAVRHGIDGACAILASSQLILIGLLHSYGFDLSRFTEYQVLMLVLTLTGLVVGALVSERQSADQAARVAAGKLQRMQAEAAHVARFNLVSGMAAAIAHEINQPMTAARALARSSQQLLSLPGGDTERARANIAIMIEQIDHAAAIVRNMREFLRRGVPNVAHVEVRAVIAEAVALLQPLAQERKIKVTTEVDVTSGFRADRVQIQQVITNLVRNALDGIADSGRADGRVTVAATQHGRQIEIAVRDNGVGIDSEHSDAIFEPLKTSKPDGIGLGLSICKSIVEAHGGRIWLQASASGATEFRFMLPAVVSEDVEAGAQ